MRNSESRLTRAYETEGSVVVGPDRTAFEAVNEALSEARSLSFSVIELTSRMLGAVPEPADGKHTPSGYAVLPELRDYADAVRNDINRATEALLRLQRALPRSE